MVMCLAFVVLSSLLWLVSKSPRYTSFGKSGIKVKVIK